jgi:hypothetical protein
MRSGLILFVVGAVGCADDTGSTTGSTSSGMVGDCAIFPGDNPWNQDVSDLPLHPDSDTFIDAMGRDTTLHPDFGTTYEGAPNGIAFVVVGKDQPKVPITFGAYEEESDPGPYPIPGNAPIEGGPDGDGDRHVIVLDTDACTLYELFRAFPKSAGASWDADAGAVFDLRINDHHPLRKTSADAAGLPIYPGLVRYDEVVEKGEITHALRFTVSATQTGYIFPARHYASTDSDPSLPPMGLRVRMRATFDCSLYTDEIQVLCKAFKKYGLLLADNGSDWFVSRAPDPRWDDDALSDLRAITGHAFEVVYTGEIETY